jgi:hypothetical protein
MKTVWYYNNLSVGQSDKSRGLAVSTFVQASQNLPAGYWRCTLQVKFPGSAWKTVKEARTRLR